MTNKVKGKSETYQWIFIFQLKYIRVMTIRPIFNRENYPIRLLNVANGFFWVYLGKVPPLFKYIVINNYTYKS